MVEAQDGVPAAADHEVKGCVAREDAGSILERERWHRRVADGGDMVKEQALIPSVLCVW
jgi:hypothetical protein